MAQKELSMIKQSVSDHRDIIEIKVSVARVEEKLISLTKIVEKLVSVKEFKPVRNIAYGIVSIICSSVLAALVYMLVHYK